MSNNGFFAEVSTYDDVSNVVVEVTQYHRDTYGVGGDIRVQTCNGLPYGHNVWLDRAASKKLRKALKQAEKFLES